MTDVRPSEGDGQNGCNVSSNHRLVSQIQVGRAEVQGGEWIDGRVQNLEREFRAFRDGFRRLSPCSFSGYPNDMWPPAGEMPLCLGSFW